MAAMNTSVFQDAEIVPSKVKRWYHVYAPSGSFGFSSVDGNIVDHPERYWEGRRLGDYYENVLVPLKYEYVKVVEYEI